METGKRRGGRKVAAAQHSCRPDRVHARCSSIPAGDGGDEARMMDADAHAGGAGRNAQTGWPGLGSMTIDDSPHPSAPHNAAATASISIECSGPLSSALLDHDEPSRAEPSRRAIRYATVHTSGSGRLSYTTVA
jgi:hypothetical protein